MIMLEKIPGIPIHTIIFSYCTPLPVAQIWSPFFPWNIVFSRLDQSDFFCVHKKGFKILKFKWPTSLYFLVLYAIKCARQSHYRQIRFCLSQQDKSRANKDYLFRGMEI